MHDGIVNTKQDAVYLRSFLQVTQVKTLLHYMVSRGTFSLHTLKREIHKYMAAHSELTAVPQPMRKPDGLSAQDMFDPVLFRPGAFALHPEACPLRPAVMAQYHCAACAHCKPHGAVQSDCYFSTMLRCITHGWHPPCDYTAIRQRYRCSGNYPSVRQFNDSAAKEFADMRANQVLVPCSHTRIINPFGAILKNSDRVRARVLAGVEVIDQASLTRASDALVAAGHPKIKCRMTTDLTATGVNGASYAPPFRYPSLGDALRIIKRNSYIASGDISRYFHSFPLALEARPYWGVEFGGEKLAYARLCFGHAACPYYTSTWSAEFAQWARAQTIDPAYMVDDWLLNALLRAVAEKDLQTLCRMLENCGFAMSKDKFQCGQQIVFLGVLIDTVTMTLRFDATQARGMRLQLQAYMDGLQRGRHVDHGTIRHVCGKLNWYSEIVQSGRLHSKSWWDYERNGRHTCAATLHNLVLDTQWWMDLLRTWEHSETGHVEYKILSADEILHDPKALYVIQSDASGDDGFGYYCGYAAEQSLRYTARPWDPPLPPGTSSHAFELMVLEHFLLHDCSVEHAILLWITDNEGATWSVNKGRSREPAAMECLRNILHVCDKRRLQLVAVWVPREQNELADYLSHLAVALDRDLVEGNVEELLSSITAGRATGSEDR